MNLPDLTSGVTLGVLLAIAGGACAVVAGYKIYKQKTQKTHTLAPAKAKARIEPVVTDGAFDAFVAPAHFKPSPRSRSSHSDDVMETRRVAERHKAEPLIANPLFDIPYSGDTAAQSARVSPSIHRDTDSSSSHRDTGSSSSYGGYDSSSSSDSGSGGGGGD